MLSPGRSKVFLPLVLLFLALLSSPVAAEDSVHIVQRGDTLYRISQTYGVPSDAIAQANNISNIARIDVGQSLIIPDLTEAVETPLFAAEPTHHIIQPGETLASIATRYGLTVNQLSQINNITNPNRILWGQTLTVFTAPEPETAPAEAEAETVLPDILVDEPAVPVNGTPYVVQTGEHLSEIAQRYGVSWPAIVQANNITNPNLIEAGQTIIIPDAASITDLGIIAPLIPAPDPTITVGKQILVDLSDSRIYAFEDGAMVHTVLASTGLPRTPTVQGNFTVQRKYTSQTMSGPGYYLPGVEWIMYFYAGYAIHGTYWHNNFGQPMSHGCVNLPNEEALWFYDWAPVGTPVTVQA